MLQVKHQTELTHVDPTAINNPLIRGGSGGARTLIGREGCIFTYSGSVRLISFEINSILKETSRAEPKYMNTLPPPN